MKKAELFSSGKYFKASDLDEPVVVRIEVAKLETLRNGSGEAQKLVVYFERQKKCLPLNLVNFDSIYCISGKDDSDDWPGTLIELYADKTTMNGQTVDCVRVREPTAGAPAVNVNRRPLKAAPARKAPAKDDLDEPLPAQFRN